MLQMGGLGVASFAIILFALPTGKTASTRQLDRQALIWAVLTLATIWVLWTGILLWFKRTPGNIERRIEEIRTGTIPQASS